MNVFDKLKKIKIENIIWVIYIFISIFAIYSNYLEKKFVLNNDKQSLKEKKIINILIAIIVFFIYIYFLKISYQNLIDSKINKKIHIADYVDLSSAILFLIAGLLNIYTSYHSDEDEIGIIF